MSCVDIFSAGLLIIDFHYLYYSEASSQGKIQVMYHTRSKVNPNFHETISKCMQGYKRLNTALISSWFLFSAFLCEEIHCFVYSNILPNILSWWNISHMLYNCPQIKLFKRICSCQTCLEPILILNQQDQINDAS